VVGGDTFFRSVYYIIIIINIIITVEKRLILLQQVRDDRAKNDGRHRDKSSERTFSSNAPVPV